MGRHLEGLVQDLLELALVDAARAVPVVGVEGQADVVQVRRGDVVHLSELAHPLLIFRQQHVLLESIGPVPLEKLGKADGARLVRVAPPPIPIAGGAGPLPRHRRVTKLLQEDVVDDLLELVDVQAPAVVPVNDIKSLMDQLDVIDRHGHVLGDVVQVPQGDRVLRILVLARQELALNLPVAAGEHVRGLGSVGYLGAGGLATPGQCQCGRHRPASPIHAPRNMPGTLRCRRRHRRLLGVEGGLPPSRRW
mmetsp:Transcript_10573/g.30219  ORF Transcript_10573/g.30219 Transcript_10573/m.30219 type:complete len:250 (-) Transcript_10573:140-889(-)